MRVFVHEGGELHRGRQTVQDSNAAATGRPQRPAEVVDRIERDAVFDNRRLERGGPDTGIAGSFIRLRERLAIRLRDILSRDSATRSRQRRLGRRGDTCMTRIRGACGDAFRTGLPRLFKNVDPFRKPDASVNPAPLIATTCPTFEGL